MAGFKRNNKPSKDFESELNNAMEEELEPEEDDYGFYDDEEDEIMEFKPRQQKKKEEQKSNTSKCKSNNSKSKQPSTKSNNTKMIGIGLVVGLAVIVILVGVTLFGGKNNEEEKPGVNGQQVESSEEMTSAEDQEKPAVDGNTSSNPMLIGNNSNNTNSNNQSGTTQETTAGVSMEDSINPGLPDPEKGKQNVNNGTIEDASGFLVDINGNQIPQNYKVKKIEYETDFVSYVKKRGLTANGIELLWLDAEYKGHPYTVQVPFKIWKELDSQGITVVDMEVLYLENDAKVISYMKVKENYKEIMEKGEAALDR